MEGDGAITTPGYVGDISIHSLRMEGDSRHCACGRSQLHFNPLPPHGGRLPFSNRRFTDSTFQSTPSAWRETVFICPDTYDDSISIHSLRMEGDATHWHILVQLRYFNPLPPHGGRLSELSSVALSPNISIHSLRMEGDIGSLSHI